MPNVNYMGSTNFLIEVAKGKVAGHSFVNKFGHNPTITTATDPEDVWAGGGIYAFYPTSAQAMEIVSSSTEDGPGGTGALTVFVYGLNEDWEETTETLTMNGTTPVPLTNTYRRMYRAFAITAGSNETNVGNITVRDTGTSTTAIYIAAGDGQTQQAIYTIPGGHRAWFVKGYVGVSSSAKNLANGAVFKWKVRPNNGVNGAWQVKGQIECINYGSSWFQYEYGIPAGPLPEKTDIRIECTEVSDTFGVVGGFDLLLVKEGYE